MFKVMHKPWALWTAAGLRQGPATADPLTEPMPELLRLGGAVEDRQILRGVSLDIPAGSSCAIVGPSGSGKSTLLRLLMRMYDVNQGSVTMDGASVRCSLSPETCFLRCLLVLHSA